jgi:hypothetical protein
VTEDIGLADMDGAIDGTNRGLEGQDAVPHQQGDVASLQENHQDHGLDYHLRIALNISCYPCGDGVEPE